MQITAIFESIEEMEGFAKKLAGRQEAFEQTAVQIPEPAEKATEAAPEPVQTAGELEAGQAEADTVPFSDQKTEESGESAYTLEDVRAKLAQLQKAGKRAEVKELLASFGAAKLSEIPASKYAVLMVKAGELDA